MKKRIKYFRNFRSWLEKNKIFFELLSMVVLSTMAIIVSKNANEISTTQTRIMEYENQPNFDLVFYQSFEDSTNIPTSIWNVYNRGGRVTDYELEDISFVRATILKNNNYIIKLIPLFFYLDFNHTITGETAGLVEILKNNLLKSQMIELNRAFRGKGYIEIETYLKISYTNFLNVKKSKYFQLSPVVEISKSEWEYFLNYKSTHSQVDFENLTFKRINTIKGYNLHK